MIYSYCYISLESSLKILQTLIKDQYVKWTGNELSQLNIIKVRGFAIIYYMSALLIKCIYFKFKNTIFLS